MFDFCSDFAFPPFFKVFDSFSPYIDYNRHCFKILNVNYLQLIGARKNYILISKKEKKFDVENFIPICRGQGKKLKQYITVIMIDD